ncbi:MAG TPA: HAMP domain-containing sensor histidine kinase [bacterium]|nr:HAMP domain-containing sensor histidine kinase [bacterium]
MARSLRAHLLVTFLAVAILGLGGLTVWTGQRLQAIRLEQAKQNLALQAELIAAAVREPLERLRGGEAEEHLTLAALTQSYARSIGGRVTVISPEFRVLASSDAHLTGRLIDAPEVAAARAGREEFRLRREGATGGDSLFVAARVGPEGGRIPLAFVQLAIPATGIYAEIRRTWLGLLLSGGVLLLVTVIASAALARRIAAPIHSLTEVTEAMAAGELAQPVTPAGPEEVERLGRAFNRMAERVRDTLTHQEAFVAHAAHELRSPLTSLRLRLELLQAPQHPHDEMTRRYLAEMTQQVASMQRLVDHLLALSALDEDHQASRAPLDLAPLLYELADEMGPLARAAGLDLAVDVPAHLPAVSANADQMRIVVRNLLDNAVKYTPAPGRITLAAAPDRGAVALRVTDTGVGIPVDHLPLVFDRFYRVEGGGARRVGGSGLGLALVRGIVKAHGGEIRLDSEPGRGTTSTVRLPTAASGAESSTRRGPS